MKTLSAFTETAIDSPHVEPVRLFEITIGSTTLYLCDRVFGTDGLCIFNGQLYEPLVLSWETIKAGRIDPITYEVEPGQATLTIDNSQPVGGADCFSALFASNNPHYSTITISDIFAGATAGADKDDLFAGKVEDLVEMTATRVTIDCSGFELDVVNKFAHTIVDATTYPGADPDDIGKMVPQIYGSVKRSPCLAIDAGGKTTIAEDMTESSPTDSGTLKVTDASALPSSGAFTIQVDDEQIRIASRSGNTLTLASSDARAYGSEPAVAHNAGAVAAEIQTEYVYIIADHPVKTIDDIYVDDIRQTTGFTAYTGQSGDEKTGYSGKAVVVFSTLPSLKKQVNIDIDSDGRSVTDTGHDHSTGGSTATITAEFETSTTYYGTIGNPANVYDGSSATSAYFSGATGGNPAKLYLKRTSDLSGTSGTPKRWRIGCYTGTLLGSGVWGYGLNALYAFPATDNTLLYSGWYNCATQTWAWVNTQLKKSLWCFVQPLNTSTSYKYIKRYFIEIEYETASSPTDTSYAAVGIAGSNELTGNTVAETVVGKRVAADVDGFLDDGSGTYTGTASALIEQPNHIRKHVLVDRCGLASTVIDAASDAIAETFFSTNGYILGFPILQRPNVRKLLNRVATQAKALEFWDAGKHYIIGIESDPDVNKTIDDNRVGLGQIWVKFTDRVNIKNTLSARYDRQWSGHDDEAESDRAVVVATDSQSVSDFGELQGDPFSFPYVAGATQAQAVLNWKLDDLKNSRLIVELAGGYYLKDIQRGDVINFDRKLAGRITESLGFLVNENGYYLTDGSGNKIIVTKESDEDNTQLEKALLGLVIMVSDKFRVIEKAYRPDAAIQLSAIKI